MSKRIVSTSRRKKGSPLAVRVLIVAFVIVIAVFIGRKIASNRPASDTTAPSIGDVIDNGETKNETSIEVEKTPATNDIVEVRISTLKNVIRPKEATISEGKTVELGRIRKAPSVGAYVNPTNVISHTPRQFESKTENFFARYIGSSKHPAMIFPQISDEWEADCLKCLQDDIVIYEDDSDDVVKMKEAVAAMKADMAKAIEEGYSIKDILTEMRKVNNQNVRERIKMQHELNVLLKSGDVDGAKAYFDEANKQLDACSLAHLNFDEKLIGKGQADVPTKEETSETSANQEVVQ